MEKKLPFLTLARGCAIDRDILSDEENLMKSTKFFSGLAILVLIFLSFGCKTQQQRAVESITAGDLKVHLDVIASDEFRGRNTPSQELKIASRYIATLAESYGLKPLTPDGSFFQEIPLEVNTIDQAQTRMRLIIGKRMYNFSYPDDFGIYGRIAQDMKMAGRVLFVGFGFSSPDSGWDDLEGLDLKGKVVVMLDPDLPENHMLRTPENRRLLYRRSRVIGSSGAAAVLIVVSKEREKNFADNGYFFDNTPGCQLADDLKTVSTSSSQQTYLRAEIRHNMAADILGISVTELEDMFAALREGKQVPGKNLPDHTIDISVSIQKRKGKSFNIVAWLEGTDERLKQEYVLFGSHHDHIGAREGKVFNGADDNGSGTVAMLELAQAMQIERPKRSVIFVWHTAEEKGLWGSRYFVEHSPVPVENMSAELNMDMICRNDPGHLYIIGSNKLSSELDTIINAVNDKHIRMNLDYKYEDPQHPDNFFFRSDQYPYIQYGIPSVWYFCGTTEDYHQETDTIERVDFSKMEKVTRFVYLTAMVIGNKPEMLELDLHPEITSRGQHNLKIKWQ
jgi:hypothetical protein